LDKNRVAIWGASYGGFATLAMLTHYPDLFACGIDFYGFADFKTFLQNTAPYRRPLRIAEYGDPTKDAAFFDEISPLRHADKIKAPLLVVQGANDPIMPASESQEIANKIKSKGGTVKYLLLPDEGHGIAKLANRMRVYEEMTRFLDQVLPGRRAALGSPSGALPTSPGLARPDEKNQKKPLAITGITVVDCTGNAAQPDTNVVITCDRITALGRSKDVAVPDGAQIIDGRGKFLIPGLWDMHVHFSVAKDLAFPALIANGVTGVRDMGGDLLGIDRWRSEIEAGRRVGPRIFRAGPFVDGPKEDPTWRLKVTTPAEARRAVLSLKQDGVDFIKVHNLVPRVAYLALADECRKRRITFVGHIPRGISAEEASDAGQKSIEHSETLLEAANFEPGSPAKNPEESLAAYTTARRKALFEKFVKNNTWFCPTLAEYWSFAYETDPVIYDDTRIKYLAPGAKAHMDRWFPLPPRNTSVENYAGRRAMFRNLLALVGEMHRAGVGILAGTDPPVWGVYPGFGLHEELALLVQAGLSPYEALQSATRNPARFFNKLDELGTVEKGKVADLVLLEADPLKDIRNTTRIAAVVTRGRLIEKPELTAMLAELECSAK